MHISTHLEPPCNPHHDGQAPMLLQRGQFHLMPGQTPLMRASTLALLRHLKWQSLRGHTAERWVLTSASN